MKLTSNIRDIYHTLRHVKPVQVSYRLKYGLKRVQSLKRIKLGDDSFLPVSMLPIPPAKKYLVIQESGVQVEFLNKSETYESRIQWNELKHGRLWNYHLQYADFLKQDDLSVDFRAELVLDLYRWLEAGKLRPEPYPASLRIMNVIRFLSENQNDIDAKTDLVEFLYSEVHFLENRLEYHLLGNHLMENAFALLMGGVAFSNQQWIQTAINVFNEQIPEQILQDGAHFERSPMYHLIMLFRFLEAIYYLPSDSKLSSLFYNLSKKMLGWIEQMSFDNGDLAHFNDSTDGQSYSKNEIEKMAKACGIRETIAVKLSNSGFRKFNTKNFELLIDAEGVEPSYQPGHAHADSLSFILHAQGKPFITDPGISTYEEGETRNWERSTKAHNTITYNRQNTADIWSRFRVGNRPEVMIQKETDDEIEILLKQKLKSGQSFEHKRNVKIRKEFIEIKDTVNLEKPVEGRLYFDPSITIRNVTNQIVEFSNGMSIQLENVQQAHHFAYQYCRSFNLQSKSNAIEYKFSRQSTLKIVVP